MKLKLVEIQTFVSTLEKAKFFYNEILGFEIKSEGENWIIFNLQGLEFVVQSGASPKNNCIAHGSKCETMMVLATNNIQKTVSELKGKGVKFLGEVTSVVQGKFVGFQDLDGNTIELVEVK